MRASRLIAIGLLGASAACASGSGSAVPEPQSTAGVARTRLETPKGVLTAENVTGTTVREASVRGTTTAAWNALPTVFESLGIPVATVNTRSMVLGSGGSRVRRSLKGTRLSTFFDCGVSAMGIRNADEYTMSLDVLTQIVGGDQGWTTVRTSARASAAAEGTSERRVSCSSTGALETLIADKLRELVEGKS